MLTAKMISRRVIIVALMLLICGCATTREHWEHTIIANNIEAYEDFLRHHGKSEYADKAKKRLEVLYSERDWKSARDADDIRAYEDFLRRYPKSSFVEEATSRIELLKRYLDGWQKLQRTPTLKAYRNYIARNPQSPYVASAKEAISDMEGRDIVELLNEKKIEVETTGSGIQRVSLKVRRMVQYPLKLRVPVGTYFVSRKSSSQNMVTTASNEQTLANENWFSLSVSAACANRSRDIPGRSDSFTIQRSPHQDELAKLIPVLDKARVPYAIRQAAVWIVTDNADYGDLGILVVSQFGLPFGGTRKIKEYETAKAMKICEEAGIDITRKAIWWDRRAIISGLEDEALKTWLKQKK